MTCNDCAVRWNCALEVDGPLFERCPQCDPLAFLRRVMDAIHAGGSIWSGPESKDRKDAYSLVAKAASDIRTAARVPILKQPDLE